MTTRDHRQPYYSRYVSGFNRFHARGEQWTQERFGQWCDLHFAPWLAGIRRDLPLLDLGCGDGALLEYLNAKGFTAAEGIDISEEQVALARARGVKARVQDVFGALEAFDGDLAAVVALDFVEHFTKDELARLFSSVSRALAPDGVLLVRTPNGQG